MIAPKNLIFVCANIYWIWNTEHVYKCLDNFAVINIHYVYEDCSGLLLIVSAIDWIRNLTSK